MKPMRMKLALWSVVLLCVSATGARAAQVRAWLDRNSMQMGETVTLNVQVSGDNRAAQPDFDALKQDFNLLGTQSSSSVSIVNGAATSKLLWAVALEPKHTGNLVVPALDVDGQKTSPLTLTVRDAAAGGGGKAGDDAFVQVSVEPRSPYVQQEVRVSVKLYYAINLTDGSLDEPHADSLVVRKLGKDSDYTAEVGGRQYRVVERHYALLPEKSGSLTLPSINFRGHAVDPNDFNSFFNRGRPIAAHSDPITLDVRTRPTASGNDVWLPARAVTLSAAGIDGSTQAKVGEPLTLTLRLQAQGLGYEQLPQLKLPAIDGADIYPDKSTTRNRDDGQWLFGERIRKFAVVPNRPGQLTLPSISIDWWDTAHDRAATASVPAVTLSVAAAAGAAAPSAGAALPQPATGAVPNVAPVQTPSMPAGRIAVGVDTTQLKFWKTLALFALLLWTATLLFALLWLLRQRRSTGNVVDSLTPSGGGQRAQRGAFRAACRRADWTEAARALLALARIERSDLRNLGAMAAQLDDSSQISAIAELQRACYGSRPAADLDARLLTAFANGPRFAQSPTAAAAALPPLYPFRT